MSGKLSYNILLGRPWLHDMDIIPSTIQGHLKYEYEGKIYIFIGDIEPYTLCNLTNLDIEEVDFNYPKFQIVPLEVKSSLIKVEKEVKVAKSSMGMHQIEFFYSLSSIKDLGHLKIVNESGQMCRAKGNLRHEHHEGEGKMRSSYLVASLYMNPI